MTDNTKPATAETKVYQHPDLPQNADPSLNYWAVFLVSESGYEYKGPTAAIPVWKDMPYILDRGDMWADNIPQYATDGRQFAMMENKKPKIERDGRGKAKHRNVRVWHNAFQPSKRYFEDPDVAATSNKPRVRGTMLFCPNLGPVGMGQEPHGVYAGLGQDMPLNMPGKPGHCPKCQEDPTAQAMARVFISEAYNKANIELPKELKDAMGNDFANGRNR